MENEKVLQAILEELKELKAGQETLKEGQKVTNDRLSALEESQKVTNDRLSALEESQKATNDRLFALEESQKVTNDRLSALEERQKALEEGQKALRVELNEKIDKLSEEIGTVLANVTDNVGREINNLKFIK